MTKFNQQEYTFWIQKDLRRLLDQKHNANVQVSTLLTCWYFFWQWWSSSKFLFTHKILITNICFMLLYVFLVAAMSRNFFLLQSFMEAAQTSFGEKIIRQFLWISIWMKTLCLLVFRPLAGFSCQYMTIQNDYHINNIKILSTLQNPKPIIM